jgi:hypothetical protein
LGIIIFVHIYSQYQVPDQLHGFVVDVTESALAPASFRSGYARRARCEIMKNAEPGIRVE